LVVFSPDGQLLVSVSNDYTVRFWDAATGALQNTVEAHFNWVGSFKGQFNPVNVVVFSPDGQLLAIASSHYTVSLWNVATVELRGILEGHLDEVKSVAFSPDCQLLVSASDDYTVRVWNIATGTLQYTLRGHSNRVNSVVISPDGQLLVSASQDRTAMFWDTATGAARGTLKLDVVIRNLSFSASGQYLKTDRGVLDISSFRPGVSFTPSECLRDLFVSSNCVAEGGEYILWLPPDYRTECVAVWDGIVALGHSSGGISFLEFNQRRKVS